MNNLGSLEPPPPAPSSPLRPRLESQLSTGLSNQELDLSWRRQQSPETGAPVSNLSWRRQLSPETGAPMSRSLSPEAGAPLPRASSSPYARPNKVQLDQLKNAAASGSRLPERDFDLAVDDMDTHGHGGERPLSAASAAASGFINFMLMFGLCCAYGLIMFDGETAMMHQALGVKMNLCTAAFVGLLVAMFSRIPVAIAGPDLNPVVFLGYFVKAMSSEIGKSLGMVYPGVDSACARRLEEDVSDFARALAGGSSSCTSGKPIFCGGQDGNTVEQCDAYQQQLATTTIFAVVVSSSLLGLAFFFIGRFKLARYASFVPTAISEAFLSCVGYKVFLYALKYSNNDPIQFIPAAFLGVLLYFVKARHWGNPAIVIPLMLVVPLGLFHICVYFGVFFDGLSDAREQQWMFPQMDNVEFWLMWAEGIYDGNEVKLQYINWKAWASTVPDLLTMLVVVLMDSLLKVKNTENKMPIAPQADYEVQLFGGCNALMAACGAPVGYMQLKFNVINFGIIGNTKDRRAGVVYAMLCAVTLFWTIEPFNYMPRWFLSTLLFFAGAGFVAENLWGSRKFLSHAEWLEILFIVVVFIATDALIYAVVAGGFITIVSFILKYARVPCIAGPPASGGEIVSYERRGPLVQLAMQHIADSWFMVVRLKGFVFFASAKSVVAEVMARLDTRREFVATIDRTSGASFTLVTADGALVVEDVDQPSVAEWNRNNLENQILPGDRVEEVNGLSGDAPAMLEQCETASLLRMRVCRPDLPGYRRMRWVVFDCERLDGMDASASAVFRKLVVDAQSWGATCLWTKVGDATKSALGFRGILADHKNLFGGLDHAVHYIEKCILLYRQEQLDTWLRVHPGLALSHEQTCTLDSFEPFRQVFETDAEREGFPWRYCSKICLERFRTVLWEPGIEDACLFLVHSGKVAVYRELPDENEDTSGDPVMPTAVYGHGWFLNREFLTHAPPRLHAVAIEDGEALRWSQAQWVKMSRERPLMAAAIVKAAMRQQSRDLDYSSHAASFVPADGQLAPPAVDGAALGTQSIRPFPSQASTGRHGGHRRPAPHLPHELRLHLDRLSTARALDRLGLFAAPAANDARAPLPKLPENLREDILSAFDTFCERAADGSKQLAAGDIGRALMLAGIFGTATDPVEARPLTRTEFVAVGHLALVSPLTEMQCSKVALLFREYDKDGSSTLGRDELPALFENRFAITHSDEVDSAAREVDHESYRANTGCQEGEIDETGFLWIVARLVRKHERDYLLLRAIRELAGSSSETGDTLTVDMMKQNSHLQGLSDEQWQELFWAVGLETGRGAARGNEVKFEAILAALIAQVQPEEGLDRLARNGQPELRALLPPFEADRVGRQRSASGRRRTPSITLEEPESEHLDVAKRLVLDQRICEKRVRPVSCYQPALCENQMSLEPVPTPKSAPTIIWKETSQSDILEQFERHHGGGRTNYASQLDHIPTANLRRRQRILILLEEPNSSKLAQILSTVLAVTICLSMLGLFMESLLGEADEMASVTSPWFWVELLFTAMFSLELLVRFWACSALGASAMAEFFLKPSNALDLLSVLPMYFHALFPNIYIAEFHLFRIARLVRISRTRWLNKLSRRFTLLGPVGTVLVVIWGIYLKETSGGKKGDC